MGQSRQSVMVVAGEVSGDQHSARVLEVLRSRAGQLDIFGLGGKQLSRIGVELVADLRDTAVVGIAEVVRVLPKILRVYSRLVKLLKQRRPSALLLVDFPDMNLLLAKRARKLGIPVCYYSPPQVWAWRTSRTRNLSRDVDLTLCLFGFEEEFLRNRGVDAQFVGHPLTDEIPSFPTQEYRQQLRRELELQAGRPVVAILPGSRRSELRHHLPIFLEACRKLKAEGDFQFVLPLAPGLGSEPVHGALREHGVEATILQGKSREVLAAAELAITKAGTSTVECALSGTPMVIGYRLAKTSYWIAKALVDSPFIGMPNLLAGRKVFPELVQGDLTPERIAAAGLELLRKPVAKADYEEIRRHLGDPGSQERAAAAIQERFLTS